MRGEQRGLRSLRVGLRLFVLRPRLLRVLHRAGAALHEILRARILLLRKLQRRKALRHLRLRLLDLRALTLDLRVDIADRGFGLREIGLGLLERHLVIAGIDLGDHRARRDVLVVGDLHVGDVTGHFRCDGKLPRIDECVVSRFEMPGVQPPDQRGDRHGDKDDRANDDDQLVLAHEAADATGTAGGTSILFV